MKPSAHAKRSGWRHPVNVNRNRRRWAKRRAYHEKAGPRLLRVLRAELERREVESELREWAA